MRPRGMPERRAVRHVVLPVVIVLATLGGTTACGVRSGSTPAAATTSASLGTLTPSDVALIRSDRQWLSTSADASVEAVRAPGTRVFDVVMPGVSLGSDTAALRSHPLLVVRSVTDVPQGLRRSLPGTTPPPVGVVVLVIDTTNGRIIETSTGEHPAQLPGPSLLGVPTVVSLS